MHESCTLIVNMALFAMCVSHCVCLCVLLYLSILHGFYLKNLYGFLGLCVRVQAR